MPREPDDPHVESEMPAAKLRPDPARLGCFKNSRLKLDVAERLAELVAFRRQAVEVFRRRKLDRLETCLG